MNGRTPKPACGRALRHSGSSDSSGITYNVTAYLAQIGEERRRRSAGKTVKRPVGIPVEGNTKLGIAASETPNSIGHVEYGYALPGGHGQTVVEESTRPRQS